MQFQNLKFILNEPEPKIKELIGQGILIENSKLVLYGAFKAGKSTLLQYIGMCCAGGLCLWGNPHFKTQCCVVCYLQLEMPHKAFLKRLRYSSLSQIPEVATNLYITSEPWLKLDKPEGIDMLTNALNAVKPEILIIDPLYKTISGSENSVEDLSKAFDNLDILLNEFNCALMFSSQARKRQIIPKVGAIDLGDEELRGSTAIPAWVDSIVGLRRKQGNERELTMQLRHGDKEDFNFSIKYEKETGLYTLA